MLPRVAPTGTPPLQADLLMRNGMIVDIVKHLPALAPRATATGHVFAPGYKPLTIAQLSAAVSQMRQLWSQYNAARAHAVRQAHKLALHSIKRELQAWWQSVVQRTKAQSAVARQLLSEAATKEADVRRAHVDVCRASAQRTPARVSVHLQSQVRSPPGIWVQYTNMLRIMFEGSLTSRVTQETFLHARSETDFICWGESSKEISFVDQIRNSNVAI